MKKKYALMMLSAFSMIFMLLSCESASKPPSDTIFWFNGTYSILTKANEADINLVGGAKPTKENKQLFLNNLDVDWGIITKEDADEVIELLLEGNGYNESFLFEYNHLGLNEYSREEFDEAIANPLLEPGVRSYYINMFETYEKFGELGIYAFDLSRANQLLGYFYISGLYSYEEALDQSLNVSTIIQENFNSWDDFFDSYFRGYLFINMEDPDEEETSYRERLLIYEDLKDMENSPLSLDFKMNFEKTW